MPIKHMCVAYWVAFEDQHMINLWCPFCSWQLSLAKPELKELCKESRVEGESLDLKRCPGGVERALA